MGGSSECRIGTYAYGDFDRAAAVRPLADWLATNTDCKWRIEVLQSPAEVAEASAAGELEWAVPNLVGYLLAKRAAPALDAPVRVAVPTADASRYRSLLLARRGEVGDVQALRARARSLRLGLTFADSASGGLVPKAMLAELGINADRDFTERVYSGRHDRSLEMLLRDELDVIGLPQELLPQELAARVVVLERSQPIPIGPMLCSGHIAARCGVLAQALMSAPEAAQIAQALAQAWPEFGAAKGFEPSVDTDYQQLLQLLPER